MTNTGTAMPEASALPAETTKNPETASTCCGGPAPAGASACCAQDAEVKSAGGSGCGCGSQLSAAAAAPGKLGCCG